MKKEYKLTENEMRKIVMHLQNSIITKEDRNDEEFETLRVNQYELLDDLEDVLNIDCEIQYIDIESLEIKEW